MKEVGFVGSICTPHFLPTIYPENLPKFVAERTASLQREVDDAGLDYRLWPGAEVRLDAETTQWFERYGVPTLAGSRYVLVDYFGRFWPEFADDGIRWLIERNYKPILAHPERMGLEEDDLKDLIDRSRRRRRVVSGQLSLLRLGRRAEGCRARRRLAADEEVLLPRHRRPPPRPLADSRRRVGGGHGTRGREDAGEIVERGAEDDPQMTCLRTIQSLRPHIERFAIRHRVSGWDESTTCIVIDLLLPRPGKHGSDHAAPEASALGRLFALHVIPIRAAGRQKNDAQHRASNGASPRLRS